MTSPPDLGLPAAPDTDAARKSRGAFFTPAALTRFMCAWAIRSPTDAVLEPSCGDAAFLVAAAERLRELGAARPRLRGYDLHAPSVAAARAALTDIGAVGAIEARDFFAVDASASIDAVVGNPPYVRFHAFSGDARASALARAHAHGVKLSQLANVWAAFVVHAAHFLRPDGRLALVLPAVLLTVNYAAPVRRFLIRRFARVRLVMFRERVFPGVLEEVVLLLAEGRGPAPGLEVTRLTNASDLADAELDAAAPTVRVADDDGGAKWTAALLGAATIAEHRALLRQADFAALRDWGAVELGIVTGGNKFFTLSAAQAERLGLRDDELLPVSPSGSRHLRDLELSAADLRALASRGRATRLFYPPGDPSPQALAYIRDGEARGVHRAYKCRIRAPWWRVPLVEVADLLLTYMNGDAPRLVANVAGVHVLNSVHGVRLRPELRELGALLPVALLSSLSLLGAELVGRSYGGGILKIEPSEARRLPLPSPAGLARAQQALRELRPQVADLLRQGALERAVEAIDERLLVRSLGLERGAVRAIHEAWLDLKARRAARARRVRR
ncbi:MAG: N-6 DNA methylase [Nannocystaceae bacterium]